MANSWRILLVEDDPALGPVTMEVLTSCGHHVLLANTFEAAYNYLRRQHAFQAILLDLQLGLQRGEDLILRLRAERFELPRIVILSAQPLSEISAAKAKIGAHSHAQKPASATQINQALDLAMA